MKPHPTLKNPPIVEALVDLKVTQAEDVTIEKLLSLHEKIKTDYPQKSIRRGMVFQIQGGEVPEGKVQNLDINGYLFRSNDNTQIAQFRKDGFTFSRLKPYDNWGKVAAESEKLWDIYEEGTKVISYERLAVRYVNMIEIPLQTLILGEYFTLFPHDPNSNPDEIKFQCENFLLRETLVLKDGIKANVTLASQEVANIMNSRFLLDIDVFMNKELIDKDNVWESINKLKEVEDDLFFTLITEKTKELFEK